MPNPRRARLLSARLLSALVLTFAAAAIATATSACSDAGRDRGDGGAPRCPAACLRCDAPTATCQDCTAGAPACKGAQVVACNADNTLGAPLKSCDTTVGDICEAGACKSACALAAERKSYIGCDYWPVTTYSSLGELIAAGP